MAIDIKERRAVILDVHDMAVPQLVVKGESHPGAKSDREETGF
jgi:hypothetical protein